MNDNNDTLLEREEIDALMGSVYADLHLTPKNVRIARGAEKGDGYLSFLTRVDVTGADDDVEFSVVLKCAPRLESIRKYAPLRDAFLREIHFYDVILPAFEAFQHDRHGVARPFAAVPKCFKTQQADGKEILVLENIKIKGFRMWNRQIPMDAEHTNLVFKTYGQFHAISYALQRQDPDQYAAITTDLYEIFSPDKFDPGMLKMIDMLAENLQMLFKDDNANDVLFGKLGQFKEEGLMDFWKSLANRKGTHPVILHGDCWVNNMMFQYGDLENSQKPTEICLLDFQLNKVGSPVLDLSYFFYVSASKALLYQLDDFLAVYHKSLNEALKAMNCHEQVITFEDLKREWKEFSRFGFLMAMLISKAMLSDKDEVLDFTDITDDNMEELIQRQGKNEHLVKKKMRDLAIFMNDNDFL